MMTMCLIFGVTWGGGGGGGEDGEVFAGTLAPPQLLSMNSKPKDTRVKKQTRIRVWRIEKKLPGISSIWGMCVRPDESAFAGRSANAEFYHYSLE